MIDPKKALGILSAIGIAGILSFLVPDQIRNWLRQLLSKSFEIPLWAAVIVIVFILLVVYWLIYSREQKILEARQRLRAALHALSLASKIKETDLVTGIPNEYKMHADLQRYIKQLSISGEFQIIMLDLDNFRQLNIKVGHQKADEIIAYIAQTIHGSMRRNEEIYRHRDVDRPLLNRMYRRYTGGDEFIFLLNGDEAAALGFLLRLKRQSEDELDTSISRRLAPGSWSLRFHAGLCPLEAGDTVKTALERVSECLRVARQTGSLSRAVWFSRRVPTDFGADNDQGRIYAKAAAEFRTDA